MHHADSANAHNPGIQLLLHLARRGDELGPHLTLTTGHSLSRSVRETGRHRVIAVDRRQIQDRWSPRDFPCPVVALMPVEVRVALRCQNHVESCLGSDDPTGVAAPGHHRGARWQPAFEKLIPSHQATPAIGQIVSHLSDHPARQLVFGSEAEGQHRGLRRIARPPLVLRALVAGCG